MAPSPAPILPDFRTLFESAPGLYLVLSRGLTIVAVSDAYLSATMTRREAILGRHLFDIFPDNPADPSATGVSNLRDSLERVLTRRQADAMAVQKYDIRRPESEGGGFEERFWSPVNSPVLDSHGEIVYIIHAVEDVTEFVKLKRRGNEQSQILEELRTNVGTMEAEIYRRAQQIQEANQQLRALQADLEHRVEARTTDLQRANQELLRQVEERQKAEAALHRSEEQFRQAQKLEAIGRLAGGVAHDFNNLLTVVLSYCQLLLRGLAPGAPMRAELEQIESAGRRAADLTRQLLAFSRQQVLEPRVLDLNALVFGLEKMLKRLIGEDIDLLAVPGEPLGFVRADPGQIDQVIMNLAVNARDAMTKGGKLTIETANVLLDESVSGRLGELPVGRYVMLAVSDTGSGMAESTRARMFEPFFTTKEAGKGTGLGLSTVHGIVKQSGGHIEVYSEPGMGTTIKVYLPQVSARALELAAPRTAELVLEGSENILVVEDEAPIRQVIALSLRMHGYQVFEVTDGREAISLCERGEPQIQLLITDVVMPIMGGPELAEHVKRIRPDVKVLFVSGYADHALVHQGVRPRGTAFLQKPFTPQSLAAKVREVLNDPEDSAARAA